MGDIEPDWTGSVDDKTQPCFLLTRLLVKTASISLTPHNPVSCHHLLLLLNCKAKTCTIKGKNRERI